VIIRAVICILLLTPFAHAQIQVFSVEPPSLGADLVVEKAGDKSSKVLIGTRFMSQVLNKPVGEVAFLGSDQEALQRAIDLLNNYPKVCGGTILVREGIYKLGSKGLVLPYPSYPYRIFGKGVGKTILCYSGNGEAIGYGEAVWKAGHNNVLHLSDFSLHIEGNASYGIRILTSNFSTVERIRITAVPKARPYCAISNEGPGGQTKLFRNIQIEGPFEIGVFISTDHMTLMQISVEGFRKYGLLGGWDALYSVRLKAGKGAIAGIAAGKPSAGYVRCDMAPFDLNIREFYWRHVWENWGRGAIADVEDLSPPQEGYATISQPQGWAIVAFKSLPKAKAVEVGKRGIVSILDIATWNNLRPQIPKHIDEPLPEPDVVIFKDGKLCKAQVVSKRVASSLRVPIGAIIAASADDAEVIESACQILPRGGRVVLEEATYELRRPVAIPWEKELAIEGTRSWCHLVVDPKTRKEVPAPRSGTIITGEGFVFKDVGEGIAKFVLAHIHLLNLKTPLKLIRTKAFLNDVRFTNHPQPAIIIEEGEGNTLQMLAPSFSLDDRGKSTFLIAGQNFREYGVRLGRFGVVIGGHLNWKGAVTTQKLNPEEWAMVIGNMAEGGSEACYIADGATLYLLSAGGGFPGIAEVNDGKAIVLGK